MKKMKYLSLLMAIVSVMTMSFVACGDDDDEKDMTYPVISAEGITANPVDCQVYQRGSVIPFHYIFTDNVELGAYNIEIHTNADHHTHGTQSTDCDGDADHDHAADHDHDGDHEHDHDGNAWVYNQDFTIPAGQVRFETRHDIAIPDSIEPGDYHFMIRLTDRAGWQQLRAVGIKITE
ncbi:DUF4625 domain-containing protein [uncultured Prevotella sp.]|uniref:DUF4625 domain-containing protein n=1 Tax=uncultured Prevotella sp. TaxID=159272 RepID=UPI0025EBF9ED|nr:DUF4625 domain-containing protein [uncultured Prevotella sp.]